MRQAHPTHDAELHPRQHPRRHLLFHLSKLPPPPNPVRRTHQKRRPPSHYAGQAATPVYHSRLGDAARPPALHLGITAKRRRFQPPLEHHQTPEYPKQPRLSSATRSIKPVQTKAPRKRHLATPILRTPNPQRTRFQTAYGLHPLQPRQTRLGKISRRLAVFQLSPPR